MAEHINDTDLLGSGGHRWEWGSASVFEQVFGTAGTVGEAGIRTQVGSCPLRITGMLKATHANLADAETAMYAMELAIGTLVAARTVCTYEDPQGNLGSYLVLTDYLRGPREYGRVGGDHAIWQYYTMTASERSGGPFTGF